MIVTLLSLGFLIFILVYLFFAGAIIYHLRAYTLPGWTMGKIGVVVFILFSILLFVFASYAFLQMYASGI